MEWPRQKAGSDDLQQLWPELVESIPQIRGAAVLSSEHGKQQGGMLAQTGEQAISYTAAGRDYRVSLGSFFQVNRFLIDALVDLVVAENSGALAWDLYAGVGLFARALAPRFERVVAVESAASSVRDLRHNLGGGRTGWWLQAPSIFCAGRGQADSRGRILWLSIRPAPAWGRKLRRCWRRFAREHITYVSCDPATLSRDLKSLLDSGYHLKNMHMVDLFPQTFHLESVAMLSLS